MSCSDFSTCNACSASGCHWCGDLLNGACYSEYNFFACVWSTPCEQLEKCVRSEPEFEGFNSRNQFIPVLGYLGFVVLVVGFFIYGKDLVFWGRSDTESIAERLLEEEEKEESETEHDLGDLEQGSNLTTKKFFSWIYFSITAFTFTFITIILALSVLFIYLSPAIPDFSVCVSELDWGSLISTFLAFKYTIQGSYIMQASVYNPNRISLTLHQCSGEFTYKGQSIGHYSLKPSSQELIVPGGTIADVVLVTELDISIGDALHMYQDYYTRKDLRLGVSTAADVGIPVVYNFFYDYPLRLAETEISLMELDDRRCKCKLHG